MADDVSDRFALPFLQVAQAQKEVTHNEALALVDMLLHARAESAALSSPPAELVAGQCWIVSAGGAGDWSGRDGMLACFLSGGWRFVAPRAGMRVSVADTGETLVHDGTGWAGTPLRPDGVYLDGLRIIGERQAAVADPVGGPVVDSEARAAVAGLLFALRQHGLIAES